MFEVRDGSHYKLPIGVVVTARRTDLPGLVRELTGPGGWGHWAIDDSGAILGLSPTVRKQPTRRPTGWTVADLTPDDADVRAGALVGSASRCGLSCWPRHRSEGP